MASLFWAIHWEWGVYTIEANIEAALTQAIRQRILGKQIKVSDVGCFLEGLAIRLKETVIDFSAELEQIDPLITLTVGLDTSIYVRLARTPGASSSGTNEHSANSSSSGNEIDDFVMWEATFSPQESDSHYMRMYNSLIGIDKEIILDEMASLLSPVEKKERWSLQHYGTSLPIIRRIMTKAPVVVFGGDPGTGKTALATSIGAPLAMKIGERVHFRHMSLLMRGMGYQGRAGAMIVKSFERIKEEFNRVREPMLLFFDEAEAIVGSRKQADTSSGSQENVAIVDAIIVGVDSLRKGSNVRVVAVFATNLIDHIDSALMRRCYYHAFERPDRQTRLVLLESSLQGLGFSESELNLLLEATEPKPVNGTSMPYTHSDITELIIGRALNRAIQADKPLTLDLLIDCCQRTVPSGSLAR